VSSICGLKITVTPDVPRYVLPPDVPPPTGMTRREFDAWALDTCGTTNLLADGWMAKGRDTVYVNPRTFARVKAAL
jgi:hypothetical protein